MEGSTATVPRKLNIGCFDQVIPGWINAEVTPHLFVARIPGLAALLKFSGELGKGPPNPVGFS